MSRENDWIGLCGEWSPTGVRRCIRRKHAEGYHNSGNGMSWKEYEAVDYLIDWIEEKTLPLTWNLNVTPSSYNGVVSAFVNSSGANAREVLLDSIQNFENSMVERAKKYGDSK